MIPNAAYQYDQFLRSKSPAAVVLMGIEKTMLTHGWRFVLLGGAARDILLGGALATPRDLDVVVEGATVEEMAKVFPLGRNHFGGLQGILEGVAVDIWPLISSWGLQDLAHASFPELVQRTTFNLEAIAFEPSLDLVVYEAGYLRCMAEKELELVYEPVPFPSLNLVRAALFCRRFKLQPGPKLEQFIRTHRGIGIPRLMSLLTKVYPASTLTAAELELFLSLA